MKPSVRNSILVFVKECHRPVQVFQDVLLRQPFRLGDVPGFELVQDFLVIVEGAVRRERLFQKLVANRKRNLVYVIQDLRDRTVAGVIDNALMIGAVFAEIALDDLSPCSSPP